jgi:hypothetical protein
MSKIFLELEVQAIIPTLEVYKQYFDAKYPCTDETNDGSDMPLEDTIKYATYEFLLQYYQKFTDLCKSEYDKLKQKVEDLEETS